MPTLVRVCPECARPNSGDAHTCHGCGALTADSPQVDAASLPPEVRDAGVPAGDPFERFDVVVWLAFKAVVKSLAWAIGVGVVGLFCGLVFDHHPEPYLALVLGVLGALAGAAVSLSFTITRAADRWRASREAAAGDRP